MHRTGVTVLCSCIGSELHDLGIRRLAAFLRKEGYTVIYSSCDVPVTSIHRGVKVKNVKILALSVAIPTFVWRVRDLINALKEDNCSSKIVVGGTPFN